MEQIDKFCLQRTDDRLSGTLSIEVSPSQLKYLQNFVEGQGSIREVDRILDNAIKQSEYSACHYMTEMSHYFHVFASDASEYFMYYLSLMKEHVRIIKYNAMMVFYV